MRVWLSHIGSALIVLVEVPGRCGYIEANLILLDRLFQKRRHKRINLRILFTKKMYNLYKGIYRFNHLPEGYSLVAYERPSIYYHEIVKYISGKSRQSYG